MKLIELDGSLAGYGNEIQHACVKLIAYDGRERLTRAAKALAISWALAAVSVFIAVAHLFLVPGFFFTGIYVFFKRLKPGHIIDYARGTCPNCATEQRLDISGRFSSPASVTCCNCRRTLTLAAAPSGGPE